MIDEISGDEFSGADELGEEFSGDDFGEVFGDDSGEELSGEDLSGDDFSGDDIGLFRKKKRGRTNHDAERRRAYQRALEEARAKGRRDALSQVRQQQPARRAYGGITVKQQGYRKGRVQSVGFTYLNLPPGQSVDITTRPQTLFRGNRLVIPSAIAAACVIEDIKVGRNSQFAASGGQPGESFKDTATGDNVSLDTAQPGMDVTLKVTNVGATGIDFRATLFGQVVE